MKLLVGVSLSAFGVPEDLSEQSPHAYVAEDAVDAAQKAGTAQVVGWDPSAETAAESGRRDTTGEQ